MKHLKKARLAILLSTILVVSLTCVYAFCADADAESPGPAPNSGDCVPDGSGYDRTDWPNDDNPGKGPAPNSGDGDPDGSGF